MPSIDDHDRTASKNAFFYKKSIPNFKLHWEWRVTILFYYILHLIDIFLISNSPTWNNFKRKNHSVRKQELKKLKDQDKIPPSVYNDYLFLFDKSMDARYNCLPDGAIDFEEIKDAFLNIYNFLKDEPPFHNNPDAIVHISLSEWFFDQNN